MVHPTANATSSTATTTAEPTPPSAANPPIAGVDNFTGHHT